VTIEEVVERFSKARPGYVLASYGEVGLPFYRLRLRLAVLEHKDLPPIQEFVLRSVAAGLVEPGPIGKALGLSEVLVRVGSGTWHACGRRPAGDDLAWA
jgi:hypothetical protein